MVLQEIPEVGLELLLPGPGTDVLQLSFDAHFSAEVVDPQDIGVGSERVPVRSACVCVCTKKGKYVQQP